MTDDSQANKTGNKALRLVILLVVVVLAVQFALKDFERLWNICVVLLGFGAVIFVHELGHFVAAKSVGILVEAFSLGFGPVVLGISRVKGGYLVRVFPTLVLGDNEHGALSFTIPSIQARQGETEYRISLIPLGGFVKMLGQEDTGGDKPSDNPRSFGNKAIWQRMIVIAAGVFMNALSALIVFTAVFSNGIELNPATVGDVVKGMPAEKAGLKPGDDIIAIDGEENVGLTNLIIAAAFADKGEKVPLKVRHTDGTEETYHIEPSDSSESSSGLRAFGIMPASTLTVAALKEDEGQKSLESLGLQAGDKIVAIDGKELAGAHELWARLTADVGAVPAEELTLTVSRQDKAGQETRLDVPLTMGLYGSSILGMVPRRQVTHVVPGGSAEEAGVKTGDRLLSFGSANNPTFEEIRDIRRDNADSEVDMRVLSQQVDESVETLLKVVPNRPEPKNLVQRLATIFDKKTDPLIGVVLTPEKESTVVAYCQKVSDELDALALPRGAQITHIAGESVTNWGDIISQLVANKGQQVEITYIPGPEQPQEKLTTTVPSDDKWIKLAFMADLGTLAGIPLEPEVKLFKGDTLGDSIGMSLRSSYMFMAQSYMFIKGLINRTVSASAASGPIGILKMSYNIASEKSPIFYFYWMAMISVCIAVFNFLPLPVLDGGYIVMLIVEKIKGSPVSVKLQEVISYAGLVMILGLVLFVSYHDIMKWVTGEF